MTEHYKAPRGYLECIHVVQAYNLRFERGNMLKYLLRAGRKPGVAAAEDYAKAMHYAELEKQRDAVRPTPSVDEIAAQWCLSENERAAVELICAPHTDPAALHAILSILKNTL